MLPVSARPLLAAVGVVALAAVAAALYTQHRMDMMPCAWCVLQRLVFVAIAVVALLGAAATGLRRAAAALVGLLALGGVAAALYQHFVAANSTSCAMSLADRIMGFTGLDSRFPEVFAAYASCGEAKVNLLGLPYETWSGALFVAMAAAAVLALRQR